MIIGTYLCFGGDKVLEKVTSAYNLLSSGSTLNETTLCCLVAQTVSNALEFGSVSNPVFLKVAGHHALKYLLKRQCKRCQCWSRGTTKFLHKTINNTFH